MEYLLNDNRVDPSVDDNLTVILTSLKGHTEVVKMLLEDQRVYGGLAIKLESEYSDPVVRI